jgi:hypothetical protein
MVSSRVPNDDIGRFNLGSCVDEAHHSALHSISHPGISERFDCSRLVCGCQLNVDSLGHPGLEKLDLDSSDAPSHLEKCLAFELGA